MLIFKVAGMTAAALLLSGCQDAPGENTAMAGPEEAYDTGADAAIIRPDPGEWNEVVRNESKDKGKQ